MNTTYRHNGKEKKSGFNGKKRDAEPDQALPANIDAERVVCASFMAHNRLIEQFAEVLTPKDFTDPLHRQIMEVALRFVVENKTVNAATIANHITEIPSIPDLTAGLYVRELNRFVKPAAEVEQYVQEVKLASKRRAVMQSAEHFYTLAATGGHDIIDRYSSAASSLSGDVNNPGMIHMGTVVDDVFAEIMAANEAGFGPTGYLSGFGPIDDAIGGFRKAKLYFIAAMEKAGKTALGLTLIRQLCLQDIPVAVFSLEMKNSELVHRLITIESRINTTTRKKGNRLDDNERVRLSEAADRVKSWPIHSTDLSSLTPSSIVINARHAVKVLGAKVILLDYIQIVNPEDDSRDETRQRVEKASRAMAKVAKELNVPVIALAQLNRQGVQRAAVKTWKDFDQNASRPRRGDIRETAQIEMDADAIIAIHRPGILLEELRPIDTDVEFDQLAFKLRKYAELSIIVNRSGPGNVRCPCCFEPDIGVFEPFGVRLAQSVNYQERKTFSEPDREECPF
jgi:replicative DNA helicase